MPAPEWIRSTPIAHRGLHGEEAPENSLAAVEAAIEAGYAVEVDVRLSGDGVAIVFHDEHVDRLTEASGPLDAYRFEQLAELSLGGTASRIPRLTTLLDRVDGRAPLLLELKNWGAPGELERQVAAAIDSYEGPVAVQSFNPRSMAWFQRHRPQVPRGQVSGPLAGIALARYKKELVKRLLVNAISRPAFVAYEHDALPYWPVTIARRLGLPILGWTIRSPEELGTARPHVDNVIFEGFEP